jgi:DNA uptake protein ComE-like DNA-binding protein
MNLHAVKRVFGFFFLIKRERSGLVMVMLIIAGGLVVSRLGSRDAPLVRDAEFLAYYISTSDEVQKQKRGYGKGETREAYFKFDPNAIGVDEWVQLGLSPSRADAIINYRRKIGGFRTLDQISRMYVLPEGWFERHRNDIILPTTVKTDHPAGQAVAIAEDALVMGNEKSTFSNGVESAVVLERFDLNLVDSLQLATIRGVGVYSAAKVVKYRDRLGGFVTLDQLSEVWGLHPDVVSRLVQHAEIVTPCSKLRLNEADASELAQHPYLSYKVAKSLVAMRTHRGRLTLNDLKQHHLITDSLFAKLRPYLDE